MKKTMLILMTCVISTFTFAQSEKYVSMMEKSIAQMDAAETMEDLQRIANVFERISNAEKTEWLPVYYNALCQVQMASKAMQSGEAGQIEAFVDKAQAAVDQCKTLAPKESEVYALQGFVYTSRIWSDPMAAGAEFSPKAQQAFGKAIGLNDKNPRAFYLRAQLVFYTPEFWGGGPKNAYKDLVAADALFKSYEKTSSIHPDWGVQGNIYHLKKAEEVVQEKKGEE